MKLTANGKGIFGKGIATGLIPLTILLLLAGCSKPEFGSPEAGKILRAAAPRKLLEACTNDIVGFTRLIKSDINFMPTPGKESFERNHPNTWLAAVEAEFINKQGGIERTNLLFCFSAGDFGHETELSCHYDFERMEAIAKARRKMEAGSEREHIDAVYRALEATRTSLDK